MALKNYRYFYSLAELNELQLISCLDLVCIWEIILESSLVGCHLWGCTESDTTEWLVFHFSLSCIGEGNGNPLQCFCLENPMDGGAWRTTVHGVAKSRTRLSDFTFAFTHLGMERFLNQCPRETEGRPNVISDNFANLLHMKCLFHLW